MRPTGVYSDGMDDTMRKVEDRVAELLSRMDTEDKLRQMRMFSTRQLKEGDRFSPRKARELFAGRGIGAVEYRELPSSACAAFYNELQEFLRSQTRLGIPALITAETLHGTMIPGATGASLGIIACLEHHGRGPPPLGMNRRSAQRRISQARLPRQQFVYACTLQPMRMQVGFPEGDHAAD